MSKMRVCRCCGCEISSVKCIRCGLINAVILDEEGEKNAVNRAEEHKKRLISKIRSFAVWGYEYKWNDASNKLELQTKHEIPLAQEGIECFMKEWWSEPLFGQSISDDITERKVELLYKFDDVQKSITANIKTIFSDNLLSLGLYIDENFNLTVYLGSKKKHSQSAKYSLELE